MTGKAAETGNASCSDLSLAMYMLLNWFSCNAAQFGMFSIFVAYFFSTIKLENMTWIMSHDPEDW